MLVAQISDPHRRPRGILYQGVVDSNAMLVSAIPQINALSPRPDLVTMHQPPLRSGIPYIDEDRCMDGDRLAEVVSRRGGVKPITAGLLRS